MVVGGVLRNWLVGSWREEKLLRQLAVRHGVDISKFTVCVMSTRVPRHSIPAADFPEDRATFIPVLDALEIEGDDTAQVFIAWMDG
jgi:hypothetical protein